MSWRGVEGRGVEGRGIEGHGVEGRELFEINDALASTKAEYDKIIANNQAENRSNESITP